MIKENSLKSKKFFNKTTKVVFILDMILLVLLGLTYIFPNNPVINYLAVIPLRMAVIDYHDDPYIMNITNTCLNDTNAVWCVWYHVPYNYDHARGNMNIFQNAFSRSILTPKQYFESNGTSICRDNAVIIKVILDNLKINNTFMVTTHHAYVVAYYKNRTYEMNTKLTIDGVYVFD